MAIQIDWGKSMTLVVELVPGVKEERLEALKNELKAIATSNRVMLTVNVFIRKNQNRLAIDIPGLIGLPVQSMIYQRLDPKLYTFRQNPLFNNA